jgi:hypothetical protein
MRYGYANDGKPCYEYSIRIVPYERLLGREYPGLLEKDSVGIDDLKNHAYSVEDAYKELNKFLKRALMGFKGGL